MAIENAAAATNAADKGGEILKARTDKREYRRIVLKNSLEVLLISDPDTDKCAASMNVSVGSFSDPEGLEGLAHFLEHMLFYASEKYPEEDSYSKYITEHGGSTNAYTSTEHTNYHFDINTDSFDEALDRFAQFFIKPLMSADATMREIKAVDSENQKNLLSDSWRMHQLKKHLSREDHPYHKFNTGNIDTLHVRPEANGVDTRSELIKFYEKHYSANTMHLVVYDKQNLDKIQDLVEEMFQEIRNTNKEIPRFPGQPCTQEHLQVLVKAVPIKQGHNLTISWPVTPSIHHYEEAPCTYVGHLIGHEGKGSLFHALKILGWATGLYAGEPDWTMEYSFFTVSINLTDAGHDHMQDILGLLFRHINLLQQSGVSQWIFDELSAIFEAEFHYQAKIDPLSYAVNISSNMTIYPTKHWLIGSSLPSKFNPASVQKVLDDLSPDNVRIFWESNKFEGQTDKVEPWYNTAYSLEKISKFTIQFKLMQSAPDVNLFLPTPNVFIPTDFSLKHFTDKNQVLEQDIFPVLLRKTSFSRLWYKPDTKFFKPKAYVKMDFNCPLAVSSPDTVVLSNLFVWLLVDYLNEYAYYAQAAGLHYGLSLSDNGFELSLVGFNHKLRILLEAVIQKIANFEVKPDRFSVVKETVIKSYQNYKFQQPYNQAMSYCSMVLQDHTWPWTEELDALSHLEAEDLMNFVPMLLSRTFVECYIAGNVEKDEAESMVKHIEDVLFNDPKPICRPLYPSQFLTSRVAELGAGMKYFYHQEGSNPSDENSALVHYIQVHQDEFSMNSKLQLFELIAKQATFHQLRTIEQLGYITSLSQRNDSGVYGVQFIIQSSVKGPGHVDSRVESLLKDLESKLYKMSDEEFKSNVTALIDMKLEKHKNLSEESLFYWGEIQEGTLKFNRIDAEVATLREIKKEELIDFFDEYIKVGAPKKKSLSICVYGNQHLKEMPSDKDKVVAPSIEIEDIVGFRKSQPLYGSLKGCSQLKL
ncbi:Metalloenzyme LuxS/M16 peptidase-like [Arabidopsis thaliana x Arabidopsis arenosa]|uniref:Metalloenzyme LuxS/M16 peptidase-like n=1 Tax=Arabidopsis thaliana x Arabidopsis arenosa TaxID=1240361 RepID=A0A8T1ZRT8_9BRAS|nr:Metalloenzyme LuxS/M16 peptidase-like [Arabidopsis thaliana x Arabidopsis arenosa]